MLIRWVGKLLVVVFAMGILAQLTLVPLAEKALTKGASRLPASSVEVQINTFPPWELLQGKIDRLDLKAKEVQIKEWTLAELQGSVSRVELSWWEFWHEGHFTYSFQEPGEIMVIITEENLYEYLSKRSTVPLDNLTVTINDRKVQLTAALTIVGQKLPLLLIGSLELVQPDRVKLFPEKIQVGNFTPGFELQAKLIGNAVFQLPLDSLPVKVEFHQLEGSHGKLMLYGLVWTRTQKNRPPVAMGLMSRLVIFLQSQMNLQFTDRSLQGNL